MIRDLVLQAQQGDHDAFERLAHDVLGRLYGSASLILRDPEAARDAVQETLIKAWRGLPTLREPDAFEGWIFRILLRSCQTAIRTRHRLAVEVHELDVDFARPSDERMVDDRDQMERAFRRLTPEQRTVLVLHHHLGLPIAESADLLGIPTGTMKSRVNRATAALRAALDADGRASVTSLEQTA